MAAYNTEYKKVSVKLRNFRVSVSLPERGSETALFALNYLTDENGNYLTDESGNRLYEGVVVGRAAKILMKKRSLNVKVKVNNG